MSLKIKGKQVKHKPDKLVGQPANELNENVFTSAMVFCCDRNTMFTNNIFQFFFYLPGEGRIMNVEVQLNTGVCAYIIDIVGANRHPLIVTHRQLSVQYILLVLVQLYAFAKQPIV